MSGASHDTASASIPTAGQQQRWRRSTWFRLLDAMDTGVAPRGVGLDALLGRPVERVRAWRNATEEMPLSDQWRLAVLAEVFFPHESAVIRHARMLRAQLEARSAYQERGPMKINATLEGARAMGGRPEPLFESSMSVPPAIQTAV